MSMVTQNDHPPCPWSSLVTLSLKILSFYIHGHLKWPLSMSMFNPDDPHHVHGHSSWLYSLSPLLSLGTQDDSHTCAKLCMVIPHDPPVCPWSIKMTPRYVHGHSKWPLSMSMFNPDDPHHVHGHSRLPPSMSMVTQDDLPLCHWLLQMTSNYVDGHSRGYCVVAQMFEMGLQMNSPSWGKHTSLKNSLEPSTRLCYGKTWHQSTTLPRNNWAMVLVQKSLWLYRISIPRPFFG